MRLTQLRQIDLNILIVFTALAEERSVTRAAARVFLSQPALSRALRRLRDMFHDDLLIYQDDFACVVAKESRYARRLALRQYLDGLHVGVGVLAGRQTIPEQRLAALGHERTCAVEVPYFTAAIRCVPGTELIATVPKRLAELERHNPTVKILLPPAEMKGFPYLMIWHPRLDTDAAHVWLRSSVRAAGKALSST